MPNPIRKAASLAILFALFTASISAQSQTKTKSAKPAKSTTVPAAALSGQQKVDAMLAAVFDNMHIVTDMHFHKGEYNHIVNLSRMAVAANPDDITLYSDAGWLLWSMDRDEEAVALYEQGVKANPDTFFMLDELGHYYYNRKKDWPKAVAYYEQAASKPDCQPITLHMLAHAYEKNKQIDQALATWKRVLKHNDAGPARTNYDRLFRLQEASGNGK